MISTIRALLRNEDGATVLEYALVLSLIAVVCILAVTTIGKSTNNSLSSSAASL
jgi:pilus assembly protein Flp/PilA